MATKKLYYKEEPGRPNSNTIALAPYHDDWENLVLTQTIFWRTEKVYISVNALKEIISNAENHKEV